MIKKKSRWVYASWMVLLGLGVLAGWELHLRHVHYHPRLVFEKPPGPMVMMSEKLWFNRPDHTYTLAAKEFFTIIRHDHHGFRIESNPALKQPGAEKNPKTILALGDSFTYGWGATDGKSYIAGLAGLLDAWSPGSYVVLNAGCPSYGVGEEADYLRRTITSIKPDLVLLNVLSNDLRDLYSGPGRSKTANGYLMTPEGCKLAESRNIFIRHCYSFPWLGLKLQRLRYFTALLPAFLGETGLRKKLQEDVVAKIGEMDLLCKQNHARLVVVHIPERDGGTMRESFSHCLQKHCPCPLIDAWPVFKKNGDFKFYYYKTDKHFNEQGYRFLSEIVFQQLKGMLVNPFASEAAAKTGSRESKGGSK